MHDDIGIRTDAGFSLPESYKIEDRETMFRVMLAVFGCCCAAGLVSVCRLRGSYEAPEMAQQGEFRPSSNNGARGGRSGNPAIARRSKAA